MTGSLFLSVEPPVLQPSARAAAANQHRLDQPVSNGQKAEHLPQDFERQAKLQEVGIGGEWIYESELQAQPPLSTRLLKLWSERGDFSRFSSKSLKVQQDDAQAEGEEKADKVDFHIDEGANDEDDAHSAGEDEPGRSASRAQGQDLAEEEAHEPNMMTVEEMIDLKEAMLQQLTAAQHSVHFSDMLVSLLIAGAKPAIPTSATGLLSSAASATGANSRAGSPELTAGKAGSSAGGAGGTQGAGDESSQAPWGGLDPHVLGVSKIALQDDPVEDVDEGEKYPPARVNALKSRHELARERALALGSKRDGMYEAIDILRNGAMQIRQALGVGLGEGDDEAADDAQAEASSNKIALAEKIRYEGFRRIKAGGGAWGLKGGRPIEEEIRRKEGLLVQGMPNPSKQEEARDAWIGWGPPECESELTLLRIEA
jgi:Subunit 17 of Mediator complex